MTQGSTATTGQVDRLRHSEQRDASSAGPGGSTGTRTVTPRPLRRGEVEPSYQVVTFPLGMPRATILDYAHDGIELLGFRDDELVVFLRDLADGCLQLRVRGWEASGPVARELYSALRALWPEVCR